MQASTIHFIVMLNWLQCLSNHSSGVQHWSPTLCVRGEKRIISSPSNANNILCRTSPRSLQTSAWEYRASKLVAGRIQLRNWRRIWDFFRSNSCSKPIGVTLKELWRICTQPEFRATALCMKNTKMKKLKAFARTLVEEFDGDGANLFALELPKLQKRLLNIYGVGEETADDKIL